MVLRIRSASISDFYAHLVDVAKLAMWTISDTTGVVKRKNAKQAKGLEYSRLGAAGRAGTGSPERLTSVPKAIFLREKGTPDF